MENISKCVICLSDGKRIGYVLDVALDFDNMQRIGYYVVDEESEEIFLLKNEDIIEKKFELLVISDEQKLEFCSMQNKGLLGKEVVSTCGQSFGQVEAIEFVGKKIGKIIAGRGEILPKFIQKVSDDFVLVCFEKRMKRKKKDISVFERGRGGGSVKIMQVEKQEVFKPQTISLSPDFYVGKVCDQDIIGYNNEKIVSKGEPISKLIVEKAKRHNRINQLFFSLKR